MTLIETQQDRTDLPLVVIPSVFDDMVEPLRESLPLLDGIARVRMHTDHTFDAHEFVRRCADAQAVIVINVHISDAMLTGLASHVRVLAFGGTGVASYVNLDLATKLGVRICNVRHYGDAAVAEFAFALMLEITRRVGALDSQLRAGGWDGAPGLDLNERTLAIVGLGGSGGTVARIANGFGMHVTAWDSGRGDPARFATHNVTPVPTLTELFAGADVVSVHMPLTDETRGMITAEHLDAMRPGTIFINTARAEVIASGALEKRLARGDIPAGLDVFDTEPLPADSPLRSMPNLVLTPHVAWRSDGANRNLTRQCVESIASYFTGGDYNAVTPGVAWNAGK